MLVAVAVGVAHVGAQCLVKGQLLYIYCPKRKLCGYSTLLLSWLAGLRLTACVALGV